MSLHNIVTYLLDTPEKHWLVVYGYHIHKSFWGIVCVFGGIVCVFGGIVFLIYSKFRIGITSLVVGIFILIISIVGQKFTHGKYKLEVWEKYPNKTKPEKGNNGNNLQ